MHHNKDDKVKKKEPQFMILEFVKWHGKCDIRSLMVQQQKYQV